MRIGFQEAARVLGGLPLGAPDPVSTGAAINSKKVKPGDLFFALRGSSFDGHDFVKEASFRGAAGAVVSREVPEGGPQILCEDPATALVRLGAWVRDTLDPLVVGITGSTGKTTVKDLLHSIASRRMPTVASVESFNNDLGVPLTLAECRSETEVVICEMGARGPGQIARLCEFARPHVGVVTNVGLTHFEMFGSQLEIAAAKSELVASLPEGGAAVLNADDPLVMGMVESTVSDVKTFGQNGPADVAAFEVEIDHHGRASFRLVAGSESESVSLRVPGIHQVSNALAASAAALSMGLSLADCRKGLESATVSRWRMETTIESGVTFVNDSYNANPTSVASALQTCAHMASDGRLVAILGWMAELGEVSEREHRRIGALASATADRLIVVGNNASPITQGATAAGMKEVIQVHDATEAISALGPLQAGDVVLVKASRAAGLEQVAELALGELKARVP